MFTAWELVYRLLRYGFAAEHYHRGRTLQTFAAEGDRIVATCADGSVADAAVLIGANGLRSAVRQACLPEVVPLYACCVALRAETM